MEVITVIVEEKQTLLDIAIQYLGDATGAIALAKLNNLAITGELSPGQRLSVDARQVINTKVVTYLKEKNNVPVTF